MRCCGQGLGMAVGLRGVLWWALVAAGLAGCGLALHDPLRATPPDAAAAEFPFRNTSLSWGERVRDLVGRLNLTEKALQMARGGAAKNAPAPGIGRLGILPHIWGTECASGLGSDDDHIAGTSFPQSLGLAATWDTELVGLVGNATSTEVRAQHNLDLAKGLVEYHHGIHCWSPVINIMRHWAWGRNDETYGECPVLQRAMARAFVTGLQGSDERFVAVTAGCKHMGVHGGPDATRRTFVANVTLRDWATTFLPPFEECVRAGGLGIMCSFNAIGSASSSDAPGVPACASHRSMATWAKEQWGFPGYIVSDQGAAYGIMSDHHYAASLPEAAADAIRAGLDLEDANSADQTAFSGIEAAVAQGLLSEAEVDAAVSRLFYVRMRTGEFDPPETNPFRQIKPDQIRSPAHLALTRRAATASIVLLANGNGNRSGNRSRSRGGDGLLPIAAGQFQRVVVIGPFGACQSCLFGKYSPRLEFASAVSVVAGLTAAGQPVTAVQGCSDGPLCTKYDAASVKAAAADADLIILAVGLGSQSESEGLDRPSLAMPGEQPTLVADVAKGRSPGSKLVAAIFAAGPVDPAPFASADAILNCFYPAETAGTALADVLLGKVGPSGRLPFSWPTRGDDVPPEANYTMAGRTYRYGQPDTRWPFGHGLVYGRVAYSPTVTTSATKISACDSVTVTAHLTLTSGQASVAEVAQLYLRWSRLSPEVATPALSLADFKKVTLRANTTVAVELTVSPRDMAVLTEPQCGPSPDRHNVGLHGTSLYNLTASDSGHCCRLCAEREACQAFSFAADDGHCRLFPAWERAGPAAGVVSGQPLNTWVVRPGTLDLAVGPSSAAADLSPPVQVEVVGDHDTPLSHCE